MERFHIAGHAMNGHLVAIGAAAITSGLLAGVLFAFSSFVMPALRRIPAPEGVSAMQSINRQATTFWFGSLMVVTVLLAAGTGLHAVTHRQQPGSGWVGLAATAILIALVITGGYSLPRNSRLATFDAATPEAARYWSSYLSEWIVANHLRVACCVIAAVSYTMALRQR